MRKKITSEMLDYIREHYADEPASDIADVLGVSGTTVSKLAKKMELKKSSGFNKHKYHGRYTHKGEYK